MAESLLAFLSASPYFPFPSISYSLPSLLPNFLSPGPLDLANVLLGSAAGQPLSQKTLCTECAHMAARPVALSTHTNTGRNRHIHSCTQAQNAQAGSCVVHLARCVKS